MPLPDFDALWNHGDPAGTEAKFREVLETAGEGCDPSYRLQLLTQIARTLGLQRRFDEAHALLDEIEPQLGDVQPAGIRYLLERGRTLNSSGSPDEARPLFVSAWETARETGHDDYAVDAAHMIAIVESGEASHEWNLRAVRVAEASDDSRARGWLGSLYNNIGCTYLHDQQAYDEALETFRKCETFFTERDRPDRARIARWQVAHTFRKMGRTDEALDRQRALLDETIEAGAEPTGYGHEEIGECLLTLERPDEARPFFAEAHARLSSIDWLVAEQPERIERLKQLGEKGVAP